MKKIISIILFASLILVACQREVSDQNRRQTTPGTLNDFFQQNRSSFEIFSVASSSPGQVATSKGTKLFFPPNAFVDENNVPVNGNIKVEVKEIVTPLEMIFNDMPTSSGGRLLESGGEYYITLKQNNRNLKLASGNFLKIQLPNAGGTANGMRVFNGVVGADQSVNWVVNNNPGNVVVGDSSLFSGSLLFCDNVNWINCDKFVNGPTVEFTVFPGNALSTDSTNVFVHLTGKNTVAKINWTQGLNYFKSNMLLAVPSTIIGISKKNGQFYASIIPVNIQNGQSITLNFTPYTIEQLKTRLANLH
jgi:hypothetical protein